MFTGHCSVLRWCVVMTTGLKGIIQRATLWWSAAPLSTVAYASPIKAVTLRHNNLLNPGITWTSRAFRRFILLFMPDRLIQATPFRHSPPKRAENRICLYKAVGLVKASTYKHNNITPLNILREEMQRKLPFSLLHGKHRITYTYVYYT